jgi:hypothetical protein
MVAQLLETLGYKPTGLGFDSIGDFGFFIDSVLPN